MTQITYPDKSTGDQMTGAEVTEIKTAVNQNSLATKRRNLNNVLSNLSTGTESIIDSTEGFILDFKVKDGYVDTDSYSLLGINEITVGSVVQISIKNSSSARTAFNNITKGSNSIETYTLEYGIFVSEITVNWDNYYIFATGALGAYLLDNETIFRDNVRTLGDKIPQINVYENVLINGDYADGNVFTNVVSDPYSTQTIGADGQTITITDNPSVVSFQQDLYRYPTALRAGSRIAIFMDYTVNSYAYPDGNNSAGFFWNINRTGLGGTVLIGQTWESGQHKQEVGILEIETGAETGTQYTCYMQTKSFIANAQLDVTIHNIMLLNLGYDDTFTLYNSSQKSLEALLISTGYYEGDVKSSIRTDIATRTLGTYEGKKLVSIGDSISETLTFQPKIAQMKGMIFSPEEALNGVDGFAPSTLGGTKIGAYYTTDNTSLPEGQGNSIYQRAKDVVNYNPDVIFLQGGGNDKTAGVAYTSDPSSAVQPSDYGINDPAYIGEEVDLFTDPTATPPSLGASYRGVIENLLTAMPQVKIILVNIHTASALLTDPIQRNELIETIAKEYHLPIADVFNETGINSFTAGDLLKDGAHPNYLGGERFSQVIMSKIG